MLNPLFAFGVPLLAGSLSAATLSVGPGQPYSRPCAAILAAQPGDIIEIYAADGYSGDVCAWTTDRLTIRGVNGRPHIDAGGRAAQSKAIWVIAGNDTIIDNIELSGAMVPDRNGAAIRQEGRNLTVRNCFIHDNEDGILAGDAPGSEIALEYTELSSNGAGDGFSHNIYVNHIARLTMRFCYSHHSKMGHLVKSRAAETRLLYNRFSDEATGTGSYEIDLPNGGRAVIIGNIVEQGPLTSNGTILSYLEEGPHAANPGTSLEVTNNTFVNDRQQGGTFAFIPPSAAATVLLRNNIFAGPGTVTNFAGAILDHNVAQQDPLFADPAAYDYRLRPGSPAIDAADGDAADGASPQFQYVHTACSEARETAGSIDAGAFEFEGEAFDENTLPRCRFISAIVNAATMLPGPVAPGSIAALVGANLTNARLTAPSVPLPDILGSTQVLINGAGAPLFSVSPAKLLIQIPGNAPPGDASVAVKDDSFSTASLPFRTVPNAPGIFAVANADGSLNSAANPALAGSGVSVYFTGSSSSAAIHASIAGNEAQVDWAGDAPGFVGLEQAAVRVPQNAGCSPLVIIAEESASPPVPLCVSGP